LALGLLAAAWGSHAAVAGAADAELAAAESKGAAAVAAGVARGGANAGGEGPTGFVRRSPVGPLNLPARSIVTVPRCRERGMKLE